MRTGWRWTFAILSGVVLGTGCAIAQLKLSDFGDRAIGPWTTGGDFGSANAGTLTRAGVAYRGLLALPASEARYFTASTTSDGKPLTGNCSYRLVGEPLDARWWSLTLYDHAGWLIPNGQARHSVGSAAIAPDSDGRWTVTVGPNAHGPGTIPTGTKGPFSLTLRSYRPHGALAGNLSGVRLPTIMQTGCAA